MTIIYDPVANTVTLHEGYASPDAIVVDKNGDGTYLVTVGPDWTVQSVSPGEVLDHDTWYEWKDAPADTELTATLTNGSATVAFTFRYGADGVALSSVCH